MKTTLKVLLVLIVMAAAAVGGLYVWAKAEFEAPGPLAADKTMIIKRGTGLADISWRLESAGVVKNGLLFRAWVEALGNGGALKAGEYVFASRLSGRQVMELMMRGETVVRRVTIPEGLTSVEVSALVQATAGLSGKLDGAPDEGTLLPETYHFSYGDRRDELIGRMRQSMTAALDELWNARSPDLPLKSKAEALTLASIIEKETGVDGERKLVAGVFINRLRKRMLLQSDPTVIYGITGGKAPLDRKLLRRDLEKPTAYNTYTIVGLPPGPIANPGRASIEAALAPAETKYLYFVADGTGGHAFARTLNEHLRNVARWRRIQRNQRNSN